MPMTYSRRTNYDQNDFYCTGRVFDKPVTDTIKLPDGNVQTRIRFKMVTNSSPYTSKKSAKFVCEARGARAERLSAFIEEGIGLYIHGELQEVTDKTKDETLRKTTTERYNVFLVEHCHVVSIPDKKAKSETFTDLFTGVDEEE